MTPTDDDVQFDDAAQGDATAAAAAQDAVNDGPDGNDVMRLQSERNDLYGKLARAQAEFQNARKRLEADKEQAVQFANSSLIKALLPVIDNFERALAVDPAKTDVAALL